MLKKLYKCMWMEIMMMIGLAFDTGPSKPSVFPPSPIVCALGRWVWGLCGSPAAACTVRPLWICTPVEWKACGIPRVVLLWVSWLWHEVLNGWVCGVGVRGHSCSGLPAAEVELVPFDFAVESGSEWFVEMTWNEWIKKRIKAQSMM